MDAAEPSSARVVPGPVPITTTVGATPLVELPVPPVRPQWSWPKAFLFRFAAIYFLLYSFPFPLNAIPFEWIGHEKLGTAWSGQVGRFAAALNVEVFQRWSRWEDRTVRWVGSKLPGVEITVGPAGSGDTTWNYVQLLTMATAALLVAALWSALAGRRAHPRLFAWWRVHLRFVLSLALVLYGAIKVIPTQMPQPDLERLVQPFGEASPMGLLWTFIGASPGFERMSGAAEIVAGLLLIPRRTATLGALVAMGVMGNVFAFNVFYDTPVKLYSGHLLLMALMIALPDLPTLGRLFVRWGPPAPLRFDRLFASPWLHWPATLFGVAIVAARFHGTLMNAKRTYDGMQGAALAQASPLRGIWNVTYFEVDGEECDPFSGNPIVWRRLVVGYPSRCVLDTVGDSFERWGTQVDPAKRSLALTHFEDAKRFGMLTWTRTGPDDLALEGRFDGHEIRAEMKIEPPRTWLLLDRDFRWINEFPYNR